MLMTSMLARMPELRCRVQAQHTADTDGCCRECGDSAPWPCEVYQIAAAAEQLEAPAIVHPRRSWSSLSVAS